MSVIPYLGHLLHCQHLLTLGIYGKKKHKFPMSTDVDIEYILR